MFKKALSSTMALMLFATAIPVHAQQVNVLSDISLESDYFVSVNHLYANGVIGGYPDGTFKPDKTISRAELMKVVVESNTDNIDETQYQNCFPDVKEDWYAKYVCYAQEQGWVSGYPDGTFQPANPVKRAEAVKMIVNAFELDLTSKTELPLDVPADSWFAPFVIEAQSRGSLDLVVDSFGPAEDATRGYVSDILYKLLTVEETGLQSFDEYMVEGPYLVTKVVDGDTVDVEANGETMRLRLIGVDTPETVHPNKDVELYGPEASAKVTDDLLNTYILLESDITQSDKDVYDRYLRYVRLLDGTNYNEQLIKEGYGFEYTYDNNPYIYKDRFDEAELFANTNGIGLWNPDLVKGQTLEDLIEEEPTENNDEPTIDSNSNDHVFYVSSKARTKYYCDTDPSWEDLSKENLLMYQSEAELISDFPGLELNQAC